MKITCGGCDAEWTALNAAHCSACHEAFSTVRLFDLHRSAVGEHGSCIAPLAARGRHGEQRLFFRDGMWRGPEWTTETQTYFTGGDS